MLDNICQEEFQLVYYGHFNYSELDDMTVIERNTLFGMLVKQKKEEKENYEKALQANSTQNH